LGYFKSIVAMKSWFSWKELIGCPGVPQSKRNLLLRAQQQGWETRLVPVRGGQLKEFSIGCLPEATQAHLLSIYKEQDNAQPDRADGVCLDDAAGDNSPSNADVMPCSDGLELIGAPSQPEQQPAAAVAKPQREPRANGKPKSGKRDAKIDGWIAIIRAWEEYRALRLEELAVECEYAFAKAYQQREVDVTDEVYETISQISRATLCRKRIELAKGVTALAGKEGAGRPK
jgi:putative transposase